MTLVAALLMTMLVQAKDRTIVVRAADVLEKGKTVVTSAGLDTLYVSPGEDVSFLYITLKDVRDNELYQLFVPASFTDNFTIISPELPEGYFLEVRDDKGYIYEEYNC